MNDDARRAQFETFYAENAGRVYRFALRVAGNRDEAEDLAAESLAEAYRTRHTYRGEAAPGSWLCAIVLNRWRMSRRRRRVPVDRLSAADEVASTFQFKDLELAEAIASLPEPLRLAFLLVKGEGLTHAEAAEALKVPVGTMYFRVHGAIKRLRAELEPKPMPNVTTIEVICEQEM